MVASYPPAAHFSRAVKLATLATAFAASCLPVSCSRHDSAAGKSPAFTPDDRARFARAAANAPGFDSSLTAINRILHIWIDSYSDPRTLLMPDYPDKKIYNAHNSASDLYPFLVLAAAVTDPEVCRGRMMEVLRNEVRYTTAEKSIPGSLDLRTGQLGGMEVFGAAEYAKDGLVSITELLGTQNGWYRRMVDMTADTMNSVCVTSRFGNLPGNGAEINGDMLQILVRLDRTTGDPRFLEWARRIGDAYVEEVMPGNFGLPSHEWDFDSHRGSRTVRLRDHGNETIVGLSLLYASEKSRETPRSLSYRPVLAKMFDRILESANADGMLYSSVDSPSLKPVDGRLDDNWGYVYGAIYAFYQATGETKYRDAVVRVLKNLPKYRNVQWERHPMDGYADAIESALYLYNREPVPEAADWIESEVKTLAGFQQADGHVEDRYLDGNFNRTMLMYALYKSQGCRAAPWMPGLGVGAVRDGERLYLNISATGHAKRWKGRITFDYARHRWHMNLDKNYVRLNEWPEWYAVNPNYLYRLTSGAGVTMTRLGSELIAGVELAPGDWLLVPLGPPPYGKPR